MKIGFDWTNNFCGNDVGYSSRNNPLGVGDVGSSAVLHGDHPFPALIPLDGCSRSEASRLLSDRMLSLYT